MAQKLKPGHVKVIIVIIVAMLGIAATVFVIQNRSGVFTPRTLAEVKAQASGTPSTCSDTSGTSKLSVPDEDQTGIFNAVVSSIVDIPAGTQADVHVTTYDGIGAAGVIVYGGDYGDFNFSAVKQSNAWQVTTFEVCK